MVEQEKEEEKESSMEDPKHFLMRILLKLFDQHDFALPGSPWYTFGEKTEKEMMGGREGEG